MEQLIKIIEDYIFFWILIAVIIGLILPVIKILVPFSTIFLAIMIGSISLTLSPEEFKNIRLTSFSLILVLQTLMPFLGFVIGVFLQLSPLLITGMVFIGVVTPELVSPVMTELSNGDTALSTTVLVTVGLGSVVMIPSIVVLLLGNEIDLNLFFLFRDLIFAVILPMVTAILLRSWKTESILQYEDYYPSVATIMLIILIGVVTAANSTIILVQPSLLIIISVAVLILNISGYLIGWVGGLLLNRDEQITAIFSIGMRDFAVAATLIFSAGLDPVVALPAGLYGIYEMLTSSLMANYFAKSDNTTM